MGSLDELRTEAIVCTKCRLSEGRTQVVFGNGAHDADLMFIGEAPGFHEDKQGLPFVGAAGKLLDTLLDGIGLKRGDVYVANILKCLRYTALVQLGDGSWERIGRLVRQHYDGSVMSVDEDGRIVPRRVIGWHTSPLAGRHVYRLSYASAKRAGASTVGIRLTGDHEVLTERGFVAVEDLKQGDRIAIGQGLSEVAFDVVCGTILGDGHLNRQSSYLFFGYSEKQKDYASFKASLLAELSPKQQALKVAARPGGRKKYEVVHVRTLAHRSLRLLRPDFYGSQKRVPAWIASKLNARMLAIWFMDDGSLRIRPPRQPSAEIATVGFSDQDLVTLVEGLAALGLVAKPLRGRLHFDVQMTRLLSRKIAPFVPPAMRYKLHPEVATRIPFDPGRFARETPRVLFDDVVVEDVTEGERNATFFCIDVEGTHNFVTAGGVVHNCRPPGNRDPLPDEIEACTPWLRDQVRQIDPRIIVTLGNFATQFMLKRKVGITRVRGQKVMLGSIALIPTYHPAAVLRGGPNSAQMKQIEQDFMTVRAELDSLPPVPPPDDPEAEQLGLF